MLILIIIIITQQIICLYNHYILYLHTLHFTIFKYIKLNNILNYWYFFTTLMNKENVFPLNLY